eukprot:1139285-Pyramimonas_sp.AAC.2
MLRDGDDVVRCMRYKSGGGVGGISISSCGWEKGSLTSSLLPATAATSMWWERYFLLVKAECMRQSAAAGGSLVFVTGQPKTAAAERSRI